MNGVPAATENEKALVSSGNQETLSLNSYSIICAIALLRAQVL